MAYMIKPIPVNAAIATVKNTSYCQTSREGRQGACHRPRGRQDLHRLPQGDRAQDAG